MPAAPVRSDLCFRKLETCEQLLQEFRVLEVLQPVDGVLLIKRWNLAA
jgi:hypothetical protein